MTKTVIFPALIVFSMVFSPLAHAKGVVLNGLYLTYDSSGVMEMLESYQDFKRDGYVLRYYRDGDVKKLFWYKEGQPHGTAKIFDKDGSLIKKITYRDGRVKAVEK